MLYRGMKPDPADLSKPKCGDSSSTLGVRVKHEPGPPLRHHDIVAHAGIVGPNTGGMSVISEQYQDLPDHRLPCKFGGEAEDHELFMLIAASLPKELIARADRPGNSNHRAIEPARSCPVGEYVNAIHGTQSLWAIVTNGQPQ